MKRLDGPVQWGRVRCKCPTRLLIRLVEHVGGAPALCSSAETFSAPSSHRLLVPVLLLARKMESTSSCGGRVFPPYSAVGFSCTPALACGGSGPPGCAGGVSGTVTVKQDPRPTWLLTTTDPPCVRTTHSTIASPSPLLLPPVRLRAGSAR